MQEVLPPQPMGLAPTFGFGDRSGLATPGHIDALRAHGGPIQPIFAQQSIREMTRTGRAPSDVVADVVAALSAVSFTEPWCADADHLKTPEDVNHTAGAGFVFFTIDPSEHVDSSADDCPAGVLSERFRALSGEMPWTENYLGRTVKVPKGPKNAVAELTLRRLAVKYGRAISHAAKMSAHIDRMMARRDARFEIELSLDEAPLPTTPAEHYIIAEQCLLSNMKLVSLAPRLACDLEPGVDYRGDKAQLERAVAEHAAIARMLGPYKLSLHSGSDKFAIYEMFARTTGGLFHVKTAGTSYLEGMRVLARHDGKLFRRIIEYARQQFASDKRTYRVSAQLEATPVPAAVNDDARLEALYLDQNAGRQILHVTYGSVLTHATYGPTIRDVLRAHPETHRQVISKHLGRHLKALCKGLAGL